MNENEERFMDTLQMQYGLNDKQSKEILARTKYLKDKTPKKMNPPEDTFLPFFAYGIFKPGQLCFFRIKDLVKNIIKGTAHGYLKERDGIPLLFKNEYAEVKGYLIYFHDTKGNDAYSSIAEIEPDKMYKWDTIEVNEGIRANVLIGIRERGCCELFESEWEGKEDPLFKQGLAEVQNILDNNSDQDTNPDERYISLFRLQMAYLLLWSAIERYAGLKYHLKKNVNEKVNKLAEEKCFADSLRKNVEGKRKLSSATDDDQFTLDPEEPKKSIQYYYQVRSNAAHRGKAVLDDYEIVNKSLKELLAIFKDLLAEAFKKETF